MGENVVRKLEIEVARIRQNTVQLPMPTATNIWRSVPIATIRGNKNDE